MSHRLGIEFEDGQRDVKDTHVIRALDDEVYELAPRTFGPYQERRVVSGMNFSINLGNGVFTEPCPIPLNEQSIGAVVVAGDVVTPDCVFISLCAGNPGPV